MAGTEHIPMLFGAIHFIVGSGTYLHIDAVQWFSVNIMRLMQTGRTLDAHVRAVQWSDDVWESSKSPVGQVCLRLSPKWREKSFIQFMPQLTCNSVKGLFDGKDSPVVRESDVYVLQPFQSQVHHSHRAADRCFANISASPTIYKKVPLALELVVDFGLMDYGCSEWSTTFQNPTQNVSTHPRCHQKTCNSAEVFNAACQGRGFSSLK